MGITDNTEIIIIKFKNIRGSRIFFYLSSSWYLIFHLFIYFFPLSLYVFENQKIQKQVVLRIVRRRYFQVPGTGWILNSLGRSSVCMKPLHIIFHCLIAITFGGPSGYTLEIAGTLEWSEQAPSAINSSMKITLAFIYFLLFFISSLIILWTTFQYTHLLNNYFYERIRFEDLKRSSIGMYIVLKIINKILFKMIPNSDINQNLPKKKKKWNK